MGKRLAIKGHPTRGNEVIELLEMMGGKNIKGYIGIDNIEIYTIEDGYIIQSYDWNDYLILSLEEFLEKYPFKVGDKVFLYDNITEGCVTGMKWDEGTVKYCVYTSAECWCDVKELLKWNAIDLVEKHYGEQCEEMMKDITLKHLYELGTEKTKDEFRKDFCERCGSQRCSGQDDELEYCERFKNLIDNLGKTSVKNHKMGPKSKLPSKYYEDRMEEIKSKREYDELRMPLDDDDKLATEATIMGKKILPPDGYLVGKITQTDNGMLVEYVEKKPKYPKTYEECCEIVNACPTVGISYDSNEDMLYNDEVDLTLLTLRKLLICRNAYWKIAGEQMGLGKPWDSTYGCGEWGYWFGYSINENKIYLQDSRILVNHTLVFPTEEMRDAFYENFKDLIEQCKKLL